MTPAGVKSKRLAEVVLQVMLPRGAAPSADAIPANSSRHSKFERNSVAPPATRDHHRPNSPTHAQRRPPKRSWRTGRWILLSAARLAGRIRPSAAATSSTKAIPVWDHKDHSMSAEDFATTANSAQPRTVHVRRYVRLAGALIGRVVSPWRVV